VYQWVELQSRLAIESQVPLDSAQVGTLAVGEMIGIDRFSMNMVTTPSLPPFQLIACDDHILVGFDDGQRNARE
jgi:hypothetical protein